MTELSIDSRDPRRCPLCGSLNDCGVVTGQTTCWCFEEDVLHDVLDQALTEASDRVCLCRSCATGCIAPRTPPLHKDTNREPEAE